ncbi:hypothetical protein ACP3V3_19760 [Vibrio sp. PNB22_3_1]
MSELQCHYVATQIVNELLDAKDSFVMTRLNAIAMDGQITPSIFAVLREIFINDAKEVLTGELVHSGGLSFQLVKGELSVLKMVTTIDMSRYLMIADMVDVEFGDRARVRLASFGEAVQGLAHEALVECLNGREATLSQEDACWTVFLDPGSSFMNLGHGVYSTQGRDIPRSNELPVGGSVFTDLGWFDIDAVDPETLLSVTFSLLRELNRS